MSGAQNRPLVPVPGRRLVPVRKRGRQKLTDLTQLPAAMPGRVQADRDFLPDALSLIETPYPRSTQWAIVLLCCALTMAVAAACVFRLTTFAIAPGQIVATGQVKIVQPLEKGQILAVRAKDGDIVEKGQTLLELDPTIAFATQAAIGNRLLAARAETTRRRAEIAGARAEPVDVDSAAVWETEIPQDLRDREFAALRADLQHLAATLADLAAQRGVRQADEKSLAASIAAQKTLLTTLTERLGMRQQLETLGWDSHAQVLKGLEPVKEQQVALLKLQGEREDAAAAIRVINSQVALTRETFVTDNVQKLATLAREIDDLTQQAVKAKLSVAAMTLRAPVSGKVSSSAVTTKGQFVNPGEQIFTIPPGDGKLEVQAYVLNTDIGFVREGAPVDVKVSAFPYTRYGTVPAKVVRVGADAITGSQALDEQKNASNAPVSGSLSNTSAAQKTNDLVFPVTVALERNTIEAFGRSYALTPGMSVVAEIETGRQSIIGYIMYPLLRFQAKK